MVPRPVPSLSTELMTKSRRSLEPCTTGGRTGWDARKGSRKALVQLEESRMKRLKSSGMCVFGFFGRVCVVKVLGVLGSGNGYLIRHRLTNGSIPAQRIHVF